MRMIKVSNVDEAQELLELRAMIPARLERSTARETGWSHNMGVNISNDVIFSSFDGYPERFDYPEHQEHIDKAATAIAATCECFLGVELAAVNTRLMELGVED